MFPVVFCSECSECTSNLIGIHTIADDKISETFHMCDRLFWLPRAQQAVKTANYIDVHAIADDDISKTHQGWDHLLLLPRVQQTVRVLPITSKFTPQQTIISRKRIRDGVVCFGCRARSRRFEQLQELFAAAAVTASTFLFPPFDQCK